MKIVFAGAESKLYSGMLKEIGAENILQSAFYLRYKNQPNEDNFPFYLLDSGGFTARKQKKDIDVRQYIDFLNKYKVKYAFELDVPCMKTTLQNRTLLKTHTDATIIPVYHLSSYLREDYRGLLDDMLADFDYVSLGGMAEGGRTDHKKKEKFFRYVFNKTRDKIKVHGLGVTASDTLKKYPFYSVDSTTWINSVKYGIYVEYKNGIVYQMYGPKTLSSKKNRRIDDMKILNRDQNDIIKNNVQSFMKLEKFITDMWTKRGVKWN